MSTWNAGPFIRPAIESVLAQTEKDWRMVVVDDQSTDGTPDVVAEYADERIRLERLEQNLGQTGALNHGLSLIDTEWVARLDQDDVSHPDRLARQLAYVDAAPRTALVGSWADYIDDAGSVIGTFRPASAPQDVRRDLYARPEANPLAHSAVLYRTADARELGGYPTDLTIAQDYGLWVALAGRGEVANVPERLVSLRRHPGQASGSRPAELRQLNEILEVESRVPAAMGLDTRELRDWRRARLRMATHRVIAAASAGDRALARADARDVLSGAVRDPGVALEAARVVGSGVKHRFFMLSRR